MVRQSNNALPELLLRLASRLGPLILLTMLSTRSAAATLTLERLFAAPDLSGPVLRSVRISPDGQRVTYLRGSDESKDRLDLWAYDIGRREHRRLVEAKQLAPTDNLSQEEEQRRERQRTAALSGIVEYELSPDSRFALIPMGGELSIYDLSNPESPARRLALKGGNVTDARFSPRGRYVSFVRDQNLFVYDLAHDTERPLTREGGGPISFGVAEFIAQEEMGRRTGYWWAPDEKKIAFTRVDETRIPEIERLDTFAGGTRIVRQRYPAAGALNASVQLLVAKIDEEASSPVNISLGTSDFYLARVNWFPDSTALAVQRESRDQKTLTLLKADVAAGITHELLTERSDTWIDLNDDLTLLERAPYFIWASSRSGHQQLYLYRDDGKLIRAITHGKWEVTGDIDSHGMRGVDEEKGVVYFMANAESPLERHLYSVSLRDPAAPMQRITAEAGWHSAAVSTSAHLFLDTFSTPDRPPSVTLRSMDGSVVAALLPNELTAEHPYAAYQDSHVSPEFGSIRARDGELLYYELLKPRDLTPGRRYPVIVDVYGGPGSQRVRRAWAGMDGFFREYLVQHGYVVFTLDNRGTAFRGTRFERALYRRLGSVEVQDQVAGVRFLETLPYVDPSRVGVFGWSYGGYLALMCMMQAPEVFAAGVSGAPVTDWRLYDTHYTERFMGTPQANPGAYDASSVATYANNLRGPLLIMHGMADDNVLFTHSTALFKTLQDLNKPFDMMTYPGAKHGLLRRADTGLHAYETIVRFLDDHFGK
ncbi:MAG TPA: alpha/beta fold hydrolase [Steroidobacteraceae bacterium]|nr:alpha/beta fold hydrolase [Steroidobacteraceae bacterium]